MQIDNGIHSGFCYEGESGVIVTAFHGTTLESMLNIFRVGFQKYLGICGVAAYFDVSNIGSAVKRALEKAESKNLARILEVELNIGKCVKLQSPEVKSEFKNRKFLSSLVFLMMELFFLKEKFGWQVEYRNRLGESDFLQIEYSLQKELFIVERFPDADSAMLIDRYGNQIVGMRNTGLRSKLVHAGVNS
jgi:hypothetical protein